MAVMIVGVDESDHSMYALEWTLDRFFSSSSPPFKLRIVHAKLPAISAVCVAEPGNPIEFMISFLILRYRIYNFLE